MPASDSSERTAIATNPEAEARHEMATEQSQAYQKDVRPTEKSTGKQLLQGFVLITAILWICLPIFWGSNWLLVRFLNRLTITTVNFEGANGLVGPVLTQLAEQTNNAPMDPHLGIAIRTAESYPGGVDQVKEDIGYSRYWGAVVVYPNCTSTWESCVASGNTSYDPTGCIGVFWSTARFYQVTLLYIRPLMNELASKVAKQASQQAVQQFLNANGGNAGAIALAAAAPQALATPFSSHQNDLRPINEWAVAAPFEAALIYYLILSFILAAWGNAARQKAGFNQKLTFPSLVLWRIGVPMVFYFWLSLNFSLLFKAYQIPTEASYGRGGFMVLWMLNWITLAAVGLALESIVALLTPEFAPFFLIFWIISNITSSFQPIEAMQQFYRWMRILPFYNAVEGYKVITHATREGHRIGLNFGVLIAFAAVCCVGLTLFMIVERKREEKNMPDKKIIYSM